MIFKTKDAIEELYLSAGEMGYGDLVGVGLDEFKHMVKFLKTDSHDEFIHYFDVDVLEVVDDTRNGAEILEG